MALTCGIIAVFASFVAYDHARLISEAETRLEYTARFLAAELSEADAVSAPALLGFLVKQVPAGTRIYLTGADDTVIAATGEVATQNGSLSDAIPTGFLFAAAPVGGTLGQIAVARDRNGLLTELASHAGVAGVLAALLLVIGWRSTGQPVVLPAFMPGSEAREDVVQTLPFGLAQWSPEGALLGCNRRFTELIRIPSSEPLSKIAYVPLMQKIAGEDDCELISDADNVRLTEICRADGSVYLIDERPLEDGGFITLISDITAQKRATRALQDMKEEQRLLAQQLTEEKFRAEAASRAKTSFLAHLSHDVRTPLNHIIGFADLIAHETYGKLGDKRYLNYINDIKASGEKLLASFAEILELAQLESGQLILRRERVEVAAVMRSVANRFRDKAQRAGLTFETSIPSDSNIYADRLCLERMLGNLVENAIQFTPSGGQVRLAAWPAADGVVMEVSDTGMGMSEDRLKDLSQPFVLGDAAFTRESCGVGLGIAISRAIAELSGGELAIDSSPAVGTTVAISLPLRAPASSTSRAA